MNKCVGCGVILQYTNKEKLGYIPKEKYENKNLLCERCFRILHYNDLKQVDLGNVDVLNEVNKSKTLAFFLVDLLNLNTEVIDTFKKIKTVKCLVISKSDYIPKYIKKENIKELIVNEYHIDDDIIFLSSLKSKNIKALTTIMHQKNKNSAYLLGYTNAGKSTLINKIKNDDTITTSIALNTTIDFIKIPLDDGLTLIDTPGFLYQENLYDLDDVKFLKKINPKTLLRPITYQLKQGVSIIIDDKVRILNNSDKCNLTIYMSNLLDIKKVYDKNNSLKDLTKIDKKILKNQDIVIKELGFINVKSNANLTIYIKSKNLVEFRNSFFKGV